MKNITYLILLTFITPVLRAQQSGEFIPSDAQYVFSINLEQLNKKSGGLNYMSYLKPLVDLSSNRLHRYGSSNCVPVNINRILDRPVDYGINLNVPVSAYKRNPSLVSGTVFVFALKDAQLFESAMQTECDEDESEGMTKRYSQGAVFYLSSSICVGIRNNTAWIYYPDKSRAYLFRERPEEQEVPGNFYDSAYLTEKKADNIRIDSLFYESLNRGGAFDPEALAEYHLSHGDTSIQGRAVRRWAELKANADRVKFDRLQQTMEGIIASPVNAMNQNRNFAALMAGAHDVSVYINAAETLLSSSANPFTWGRSYVYKDMQAQSRLQEMKLMREISSCYSIDFMNGKAEINMLSNYGENVYPYIRKIYKSGQNKDLLKYIDGSDLLGIVSFSASAKEAGKFYEALYSEIIRNTPILRDENILPAMRLLYTFIDKEVLYNTLDGSAILACTGFTDVRMKYHSYQYDDDFNRKEITEEKMVKQPKIILASSIGNAENAKKLFGIIRTFSVMEYISEHIIAVKANRNSPFQLYLALTDDALLISNDVNTLQSFFSKQGPGIKPLDKDIRKQILAHNTFMKINSGRILSSVQNHYFSGKEQMQWYAELMTGLGDIILSDTRPGKSSYAVKAVINLQDNSVNSLNRILHFMQSAHVR